jgi:hypothetical protein
MLAACRQQPDHGTKLSGRKRRANRKRYETDKITHKKIALPGAHLQNCPLHIFVISFRLIIWYFVV